MLKLIQVNLHHCKAASAALMLKVIKDDIDVVLVQEPWINKDRVLGLRAGDYKLLFVQDEGRIRSCILAKSKLNIFLLANYSDADVVAVSIEVNNQNLWLVSAYLPHDGESLLPDKMRSLIMDAQVRKVGVVVGCDANSHHTIWGSTDTNERGESLLDYILSTNLSI